MRMLKWFLSKLRIIFILTFFLSCILNTSEMILYYLYSQKTQRIRMVSQYRVRGTQTVRSKTNWASSQHQIPWNRSCNLRLASVLSPWGKHSKQGLETFLFVNDRKEGWVLLASRGVEAKMLLNILQWTGYRSSQQEPSGPECHGAEADDCSSTPFWNNHNRFGEHPSLNNVKEIEKNFFSFCRSLLTFHL